MNSDLDNPTSLYPAFNNDFPKILEIPAPNNISNLLSSVPGQQINYSTAPVIRNYNSLPQVNIPNVFKKK